MYQAKSAGRNSVRFYSGTMSLRSLERLELENACATRCNETNSNCTISRRSTGDRQTQRRRALLRWTTPSAEYFTGGLHPAGRGMRADHAAGRVGAGAGLPPAKEWQPGIRSCRESPSTSPASSSSMVTSPRSCSRPVFDMGLAPSALQLELTETILMNDVLETVQTLNKLKSAGVSLAMDDFGTGYSSLSYLKPPAAGHAQDRPARSFSDLENNRDDAAICAAIIAMAHSLDLEVVAEGARPRRSSTTCADRTATRSTGFFISKPLPAADLEARFLAVNAARRPAAPTTPLTASLLTISISSTSNVSAAPPGIAPLPRVSRTRGRAGT